VLHGGGVFAEEPLRKKVLFIGIDGCRTDALLALKGPHLRGLIERGAFAENTTILGSRPHKADTISGPGWSNLLTGVWPDKHGVLDNSFKGSRYSEFPSMFRRLKEARPQAKSLSLSDWGPIGQRITGDAAVNKSLGDESKKPEIAYVEGDELVTAEACRQLKDEDPDLAFVYFGNVDESGHLHGFQPRVPQYLAALEKVDSQVGQVLEAVKSRKTAAQEDWLVLVCTDHGGQGTGHGSGHQDPEVHTVFLIVSGPAALHGRIETPTAQVDVAATAFTHLGIPIDPAWQWDGQAVGLKSVGAK
jgi:arylsulfatase A-like enzyme